MRIGLFLKYDWEVVKWSENQEIPDLWGRVDRYAVELQWLQHLWNHENMFETGVVRDNECLS